MKRYFITLLITTLTAISLFSCKPAPTNFKPEWDSNFVELQITPKFFDSEKEMRDALRQRLQREINPDLVGMAIMSPDDTICEVYAVKPKRIDDSRTMTIGHEFLHCVYGRYHKE